LHVDCHEWAAAVVFWKKKGNPLITIRILTRKNAGSHPRSAKKGGKTFKKRSGIPRKELTYEKV
jgi:hypothetical protein